MEVVRRVARSLPVIAAFAALALAVPCRAQAQQAGTPEDAARLFKEGVDAQARGDAKLACAKFRGSLAFALMPNTLFKIAQCEEQEGHLVAALRRWEQGLGMLPEGDNRLAVARERAAAIERRVPKVRLKLPADAPAKTRVLVDGTEIPSAQEPLNLDTGERTIVVEAPGYKPERLSIVLVEGDQKDVEIALSPLQASEGPKKVTPPPPPPPPPSGGLGRTLGFVAGGLGLAGFVTAGVTGGILLSRDAQIRENCSPTRCNKEAWEAVESAKSLLTVNTVGFIVGIAGASAGVTLILASGGGGGGGNDAPKAAVAPVILPGGGGAAVSGRF
jgi:exonuclease VII small subunit